MRQLTSPLTPQPRFEVHLKIYDLNNVPLVSGVSLIKWHLPHSIHSEQRGRTQKCPIQNHRVDYNYSRVFSVRIGIDRSSNLVECPIEFEVLQEFSGPGTASASSRDEKISLGIVRLNLSEYIEESEAILRDGIIPNGPSLRDILSSPTSRDIRSAASSHHRKRSSLSNTTVPENFDGSPRSSHASEAEDDSNTTSPMSEVRDGVMRRYLMQESKINSTLKISILMIQVDGERNYAAPPPKSAPVFGGIAGFVAGEALEPVDVGSNANGHHIPSSLVGKSRDVFEAQDMYRRALAASWASQPGELPADECIEDIFSGGDGFRRASKAPNGRGHTRRQTVLPGRSGNNSSPSARLLPSFRHESSNPTDETDDEGGEEEEGDSPGNGNGNGNGNGGTHMDMTATLRPRDIHRFRHHLRHRSGSSDGSTVLGQGQQQSQDQHQPDLNRESSRGVGLAMNTNRSSHRDLGQVLLSQHRREESKITHAGGLRSRSSSLVTVGSGGSGSVFSQGRESGGSSDHRERERTRGFGYFKRGKEVDEMEEREDLVAWTVPVVGGGGGEGGSVVVN
ncbi:N-terminal C2 in EEIG1 and EHBP1 proteins-domain-containing protein [Cercophora samala]|uniref:N-terminal C2 in EEIG1 and EHBP1 proteins-domain-containing protein n=1 Tax=Cercophora samala TaxID=330535 RepID=A0AA40D927_9PEZI|nr:N-terminal C2 in EEIG1 and EHBP1 proteins-domain-containing protein [Cercophora samala]